MLSISIGSHVDKLSIHNEMAQFDLKNRDFYRDLTDEERKKFSNYLMIRWGSSVQGARELQEFYVIATNERLNKNFFAVGRQFLPGYEDAIALIAASAHATAQLMQL